MPIPTPLAAARAAVATAGCGGGDAGTAQQTGAIAVTLAPARLDTMRDVLLFPGTVVPSAIADFVVTASEPAEITELTVNEGDVVKTGDVLVRFEIPAITHELATRELEMIEAQSKLELAKANFERQSKLFEQGIASRNAWDAARLALSTAESTLSQVRSKLDVAKAQENRTIIRAPFIGVVAKRWKVQGQAVLGGENDPIMRIIDPTKLQVVSQVSIGDGMKIQPGQHAQIQTGIALEPAIVAMKTGPATASSTSVDVRLNFVAPTTVAIESPVQVEIVVEERKDVLVVPSDAVQRRDGATFVWVADSNNQAARRDVGVGMTSGKLTQITSGLAVGDTVIVTGIAQLAEGVPVVVSNKG